jgi:hypothetical protein|tara:strand:+ start:282 stop:428 length:147 start_codon:yes stop_codon:yes gene_type:complete
MNKKRVVKEPYSAYGLPASAEKGVAFIDFNKVVSKQPIRKVTKKRKQK